MQEVVSSNPVENGAFILLLSSLTFQLITSALDEVPKEGAPLLITWKFKNGFVAALIIENRKMDIQTTRDFIW